MTTAISISVWSIDPAHSDVGFEVKHLMISKVRGRFGAVDGTIVLDEAHLSSSSVEVEIEVSSIDTGQSARDEHLRSADFFDAQRFPVMSFSSTRVEEQPGGFRVIGDLTIRGTTREVVLQVTDEGRGTAPWGGERAAFSATTTIDRRDFGLTYNQALETGGVLIGNEVKITLEIAAVRVG